MPSAGITLSCTDSPVVPVSYRASAMRAGDVTMREMPALTLAGVREQSAARAPRKSVDLEYSIGDGLQLVDCSHSRSAPLLFASDHHLLEGIMAASLTDLIHRSIQATAIAWLVGAAPACANVITDWDAKAIDAVAPLASLPSSPYTPYAAYRMMGIVHVAMFDAVNSIERRHKPYLVQLPANAATSKEAAAAAAAATVLATIDAKTAAQMKELLASYLASLPDGLAKAEGIKLGEAVALKIVAARADDGCDAPDDYRPQTAPGVYVPTPVMRGPMWPNAKPFAMESPSQFRPGPPVALDSGEWAKDYNEIKDYGVQKSLKRTAVQTETARFWLMSGPVAYHPFLRQL